ncbi:hypothetical protein DVH24_016240 [Malus domestica]|uniref:Uncharacterized protein n=1 Tax=Malus domestica TaxID=3750 RepID=A0A498HPE6_MALDO|nr:hypothetical protein DVH24_016240 [Malus domestica]
MYVKKLPTREWRFGEDNISNSLIRSRKAVTIAPRSIPSLPTSAATAPAEMDHKPVNPVDLVGSWVFQVSASLAS